MQFTKMHGIGNDYVYINCFEETVAYPEKLAPVISDRHFGIGSDGLVLICPSQCADVRMRMFNPDGSEAEACGNGLRCFVRYVTQKGLTGKTQLNIETMIGTRQAQARTHGVRVAMGVPRFAPAEIPAKIESDATPILDYPINVNGKRFEISLVSMGNPHAVCFLSEPVADFPLSDIGPLVEHHPIFPNRTNFEIVNVVGNERLRVRVWERGAGETLSCGSGACAIAVASRLRGSVGEKGERVEIELPGGKLSVDWDGAREVWLSGPAETVFEGEWDK